MTFGYCKLCGKYKKLCKAHIVPKAFYNSIKRLDNANFLYVHDGSQRNAYKSRSGEWDDSILCQECDNKLGIYDNNFFQFITKTDFSSFRKSLDGEYYYELPVNETEYKNIKLFFISLLYRASLSNRSFSRNVRLGEQYEQLASTCLKDVNPHQIEFDVVMMKLHSNKTDTRQSMEAPYRIKLDGINGYCIILHGFKFWIKVDKRPIPELLKTFVLSLNKTYIAETLYENTNDYRASIDLVKKLYHKQK